jgi:hypothetical protein
MCIKLSLVKLKYDFKSHFPFIYFIHKEKNTTMKALISPVFAEKDLVLQMSFELFQTKEDQIK